MKILSLGSGLDNHPRGLASEDGLFQGCSCSPFRSSIAEQQLTTNIRREKASKQTGTSAAWATPPLQFSTLSAFSSQFSPHSALFLQCVAESLYKYRNIKAFMLKISQVVMLYIIGNGGRGILSPFLPNSSHIITPIG